MVMVLPMAVYFHRATMFAVPTNMLSVPLVAVLAPIAVITFCDRCSVPGSRSCQALRLLYSCMESPVSSAT
jgi:hypothetical protein